MGILWNTYVQSYCNAFERPRTSKLKRAERGQVRSLCMLVIYLEEPNKLCGFFQENYNFPVLYQYIYNILKRFENIYISRLVPNSKSYNWSANIQIKTLTNKYLSK